MSRKDYRVTVKVRNNNLLRAIEELGFSPGQKFADVVGIPYVTLNELINMTRSPLLRDGSLSKPCERLIAFLGIGADELFNGDQYAGLATNKSERELTQRQLYMQLPDKQFDEISTDDGLHDAVHGALAALKPREMFVVKSHMGIDCEPQTYQEIGDRLEITAGRVQQIEAKAMSRLRDGESKALLRDFVQ
jgi:RNA polymerase sigma factor (sigma-70 family)